MVNNRAPRNLTMSRDYATNAMTSYAEQFTATRSRVSRHVMHVENIECYTPNNSDPSLVSLNISTTVASTNAAAISSQEDNNSYLKLPRQSIKNARDSVAENGTDTSMPRLCRVVRNVAVPIFDENTAATPSQDRSGQRRRSSTPSRGPFRRLPEIIRRASGTARIEKQTKKRTTEEEKALAELATALIIKRVPLRQRLEKKSLCGRGICGNSEQTEAVSHTIACYHRKLRRNEIDESFMLGARLEHQKNCELCDRYRHELADMRHHRAHSAEDGRITRFVKRCWRLSNWMKKDRSDEQHDKDTAKEHDNNISYWTQISHGKHAMLPEIPYSLAIPKRTPMSLS